MQRGNRNMKNTQKLSFSTEEGYLITHSKPLRKTKGLKILKAKRTCMTLHIAHSNEFLLCHWY